MKQEDLPHLRRHLVGTGRVEGARPLRLVIEEATAQAYSDAQIDDYQRGQREPLIQRPPLRLSLRARFSHEAGVLRGTAGFGFWNYFLAGWPTMPRALWFFYGSPPNEIALASGVPGHGWKAASVDAGRPQGLALFPVALLAAPLMRIPLLYRGWWPPLQRSIGAHERLIRQPMTAWHTYTIEWGERTSRFLVDGRVILDEVPSPRGPMCFVAWLDNQYLVATPQGRLRWGLLDVPEAQWIEIDEVVCE
ncbi:family 16 glycosylhydrolase [Candidatus Chloroploca asiatica]|uniref:family 16 glycosylhydrolase n=1 Tax=Candidatus Chloroploca asiatica TaxID=1506545 RepID=UPI000BE874FD|nr:family 16 glycosylhydrolase [Candidatus Chloroploca asiatica]